MFPCMRRDHHVASMETQYLLVILAGGDHASRKCHPQVHVELISSFRGSIQIDPSIDHQLVGIRNKTTTGAPT